MYYMNHDSVNYFQVEFMTDDSIVMENHYPLENFAAETLDCGWSASADICQPL